MKSIIEEASSILKAIEKAWARAGNPTEFSVKIFEDSQRNFFGMTSKNAKVGVFFEIEPICADGTRQPTQGSKSEDVKHKKQPHIQHREKPLLRQGSEGQSPLRSSQSETGRVTTSSENSIKQVSGHTQSRSDQPYTEPSTVPEVMQERKKRVAWNDDMLTAVSMWLNDLLKASNLGSHQPTLTVLDNRLIILFATPLLDDPAKVSDLYRSLSYLLIGMIRSKFKKEFRFLKIVLTDNARDRDHNE